METEEKENWIGNRKAETENGTDTGNGRQTYTIIGTVSVPS